MEKPSYYGIVTKVTKEDMKPVEGTDRLLIYMCWGSPVITAVEDNKILPEESIGIYFPSGGKLDAGFLSKNNLYRSNELNADKQASGYVEDNGRVKAVKLRGQISDGMFMPLKAITDWMPKADISGYKPGDAVWSIEGKTLCEKYYIRQANTGAGTPGGKGSRAGGRQYGSLEPTHFHMHYDTPQFAFVVNSFDQRDHIVISEKVHGTSHRYGYLRLNQHVPKWLTKLTRGIDAILKKLFTLFVDIRFARLSHIYGTRRVDVVPQAQNNFEFKSGQSYHSPVIRDNANKLFEGKLHEGEIIYCEIVGYEDSEKPIMPPGPVEKLGKEFVKRYGKQMFWSYGTQPGEQEVYVYRIVQVRPNGTVVEYSYQQMLDRAKELNVKTPPIIFSGLVSELGKTGAEILASIDAMSKGPSMCDVRHLKEGVTIWSSRTHKYTKYKSYEFKVLEDIIKDAGVVDGEDVS